MAITIKAIRPLSDWIGKGKIEMEWSGGSLEDLVRHLIERAGPELEREIQGEHGSLAYTISINGKIQRKPSTPIQDGDEISFFFPIGGG